MSETVRGAGVISAYSALPEALAKEAATERLRLHELDGLRGWAAFSVLLFHSTWQTFGENFSVFRNPFTAGVINGPLDVSIFFVVSGAALSAPFFAGGGREYVLSAALKRYLRLTVPIAAAAILLVCAARLGLVRGQDAAIFAPGLAGITGATDIGLLQTLKWACCNVYTKPTEWGPILPFLWTMPWEMVGSLVLFVLLACYSSMKRPDYTLAASACFLMVAFPYLAAFLFGALIGRAKIVGALDAPLPAKFAVFDHGAAKIAAGLAIYAAAAASLKLGGFSHVNVLISVACVAVVLSSRRASAFLSFHVLSRFLAKISFPLYLVHYIVLITATSAMISLVGENLTLWIACVIAAATVGLSIAAAVLFLPVERLAHRASRRFASFILR